MKLKTLTPIDHNGKVYQPGDVFECDKEAAQYLLDVKAAEEMTEEGGAEEKAKGKVKK